MSRNKLLLTTAICGAAMMGMPVAAQAAITTTTTTIYSYDFPDSEPAVSATSSTSNDCPPVYNGGGGGDGGGGFGGMGSVADTNGDGVADTGVTADVGTPDGFGGTTQSAHGMATGGGSGGGGDGGAKVLCTYFYLKGLLPADIYAADLSYAGLRVSEDVRNGYHFWAVPLVRKLQSGHRPALEKFVYIFVRGWAYEMAYVMGITHKHDPLGRVMRLIGEPLCGLIGKFAGAKNYQALWRPV